MKKISCDFLIIGTGLAGLYSAIKASKYGKVAVISKSTLELSNTYWAQGGIAAVIDPNDSPEIHFEDTIKAGNGLNDKKAVSILVNEGRDRIKDLMNMGMEFDMSDGSLALGLEGGHSKRRILHAGGDATGLKLVEFLSEQIRQNKNITVFESTVVYDLIYENDTCYGAVAFNYLTNDYFSFLAKGTILATGGASGLFKRSTNPYTSTGDGISLAYEAGAELSDLEFIQFHPTAFYSNTGETFLISEAVRGEGAHLVNHLGERFMLKNHPMAELAPRDVVALGIYNELKNSGKENVFIKLSHLDPEKIKKRFSTIYKTAKEHGFDLTKDLIPVSPAAHYTVGGIKTGYKAETNIARLFACGEVASSGVHGANRLASNSLLECLVFGQRAVLSIAELNKVTFNENEALCERIKIVPEKEKQLIELKRKLAEIMNNKVGIVRNGKLLKEALDEIGSLKSIFLNDEYENYNLKMKSLIETCELITSAANERTHSIGGHYREDFPNHPETNYHTRIVKGKKIEKVFCED